MYIRCLKKRIFEIVEENDLKQWISENYHIPFQELPCSTEELIKIIYNRQNEAIRVLIYDTDDLQLLNNNRYCKLGI